MPKNSDRWLQLALLAAVELLAMALWFSASSVARALQEDWLLSSAAGAWLTISVQLGFVVGALASAMLNLSERIAPPRLLGVCALAGAGLNAAIPLVLTDHLGRTNSGFALLIALRMATGMMLAGVYPTGMKLMATWFKQGRGLAIGVLVGALTIGSAAPHLLAGQLPWRTVMLASSAAALLAGLLALAGVRVGPHLPAATRFDFGYFARVWADPAVRRANFGYLGHMFELYAFWTWIPAFLAASVAASAGGRFRAPRLISLLAFTTIAIGGVGSVWGGLFADKRGRERLVAISLFMSGSCCLLSGILFGGPLWVLGALAMTWGFFVIADSAQFSTLVTESVPAHTVGTALTVQTSLGFLLTMLPMQLVPLIAQRAGWRWGFVILALGPIAGIAAIRRFAALRTAKSRSTDLAVTS